LQITPDNINDLLTDHGFAGEIGVLSIDVDGNDYWIWNAIIVSNPGIIIICEYNGLFGDRHPLSVPPDDNFNHVAAAIETKGLGSLAPLRRHIRTWRRRKIRRYS
jgi:hypothetical protein